MTSSFRILILFTYVLLSTVAIAQDNADAYPNKYVTLIVSSGPGANTDLSMRHIARQAESHLGQRIVIRNEAGKFLAVNNIVKAKPDGYTLGVLTMTQLVYFPHLEKISYDVKRDFTYLAQAYEYNTFVTVRSDSPWKNFQDFIRDAKSRRLTYSTSGYQGPYHITMVGVAVRDGANLAFVPYKNGSELIPAVIGRQTDAAYTGNGVKEWVRRGELRILVTDSSRRMAGAASDASILATRPASRYLAG